MNLQSRFQGLLPHLEGLLALCYFLLTAHVLLVELSSLPVGHSAPLAELPVNGHSLHSSCSACHEAQGAADMAAAFPPCRGSRALEVPPRVAVQRDLN